MELDDVIKTTGTCRAFENRPVPDHVIHRAIESARFGPQGGNREPVRWLVVQDARTRAALGDLYLPTWKRHYDPRPDDFKALQRVAAANRFAEDFGHHPAIVVVCADEAELLVTDRELERTSVVGGASIYPLVQNFCLALRNQNVGSAITTLLCEREPEVRSLLHVPDNFLTAAHIAIGYPAHGFPSRLTRADPSDLVFRDVFGQQMFTHAIENSEHRP